MNDDFESRVRDLKARAHGRWTPLLAALGVDEQHPQRQEPALPAVRRHRPLPVHRQVRRRQLPLPLAAAPVAA